MSEQSKLSADGLEVGSVECNCSWNPDSHDKTCPVYLRDRLADAQRLLAQLTVDRDEYKRLAIENQGLLSQLREELAHAEQWRDLALQFDRHRMNAMALIKAVAAGKAGSAECEVFASVPPIPGHEITAEVDQLRARLAALESQQAASVGGEREAHVEFLLDEFDTGLEDLELRGRHSDLGYQKLKGLLPQFRAALSPAGGGVDSTQEGSPAQKSFWAGFEAATLRLFGTNIREAWNSYKASDEFARLNAKPQANSQGADKK